jgi:hypothetical protein
MVLAVCHRPVSNLAFEKMKVLSCLGLSVKFSYLIKPIYWQQKSQAISFYQMLIYSTLPVALISRFARQTVFFSQMLITVQLQSTATFTWTQVV